MPLYEYECDACGHRFEVIQKFSDPLVGICPQCGGVVHKLMSSPAIQFKGTGWYITDYAKKDTASAGKTGGSKEQDASSEKAEKAEKADKDKGSSEKDKSGSAKAGSSTDSAPKAESTSTSSVSSSDSTPKPGKTNA